MGGKRPAKIVENTDRRPVIEHRPWFFAGLFWLLGLVALCSATAGADMGGPAERPLILALGIGTTFAACSLFAFLRIAFDRDNCEVEDASLRPLGSRRKFLRLGRVPGAQLKANRDSDGVRLTRLAPATEDGRAQLEHGYGGGDRRAPEAAVNEWLSRPV